MKWCSHCAKSVNFDYIIRTECTFWTCVDCGKILGSMYLAGLGQKQRLRRVRRTLKAAKETVVRTTESSSTEGDGADSIRLIGFVKKRRLKRARKRTIVRITESSSTEVNAAD